MGSSTNGNKSYGEFKVEVGSYYALTSLSPDKKSATIEGCDVIAQGTYCGNLNSNQFPGSTMFIVKATATTIKVSASWGGAVCMKLNIPNINISQAIITPIDRKSSVVIKYEPTLGHIYVVGITSNGDNEYFVAGGLTGLTVSGSATLNGTTQNASLTLLKATTEMLCIIGNWAGACFVDLGKY